MEEYFRRTRLSGWMDGLGFHILALILCLGWFILLWGLRIASFTAGIALYRLVLLVRRKTRDGRLKRRENRLRARIGGELALERLMLAAPDRAHFEIAMLLSLRWKLTLLRTGDAGVLCVWKGEKTLVSFLQTPDAVEPGQVIALQRAAFLAGADKAVLCAPGEVTEKARERAAHPLPVTLLSRESLITLFGSAYPASDAQLVALGRRKKQSAAQHWLLSALDPRRARRYVCYGGLLLLMYQFTHLFYYAVPGLACVFLAAACRCARKDPEWI